MALSQYDEEVCTLPLDPLVISHPVGLNGVAPILKEGYPSPCGQIHRQTYTKTLPSPFLLNAGGNHENSRSPMYRSNCQ